MNHLLTSDSLLTLARRTRTNALLAFDFDGTLAPIMADPQQVQMRRETAALFARVCTLYPCAVIRSRGDVASRLARAPVRHLIGNHGIETGSEYLPSLARSIARVRVMLDAALSKQEGVSIEDKQFSLSLHYRRARHQRHALAAISEAVQSLPHGFRAMPGEKVVNILPSGAPNKGDSMLQLKALEQANCALFVGDDVTDEDAFRIDSSGWLIGVRVGWSLTSAARYYLHKQREIDDLLAWLIAFRRAGRPVHQTA